MLFGGLTDSSGLAIDPSGDLYVDVYGNVDVVSPAAGTIDGTNVMANALTQLATGLLGDLGSTFHGGNLYVADQDNGSVDELTSPTATVAQVTFGGSSQNPLIMVQGSGFDTAPPTSPPCGMSTGSDYKYGDLFLTDKINAWGAGIPGDCVGLTAAKIKKNSTMFGLGSYYLKAGLCAGRRRLVHPGHRRHDREWHRELHQPLERHRDRGQACLRAPERGNLGDHQGHRPHGDHVGLLRIDSGQKGHGERQRITDLHDTSRCWDSLRDRGQLV